MRALHPADFHYIIQYGGRGQCRGRVRGFCVSENVAKDHLLPFRSWNDSSHFQRIESSGHSGRYSFSKTVVTHNR